MNNQNLQTRIKDELKTLQKLMQSENFERTVNKIFECSQTEFYHRFSPYYQRYRKKFLSYEEKNAGNSLVSLLREQANLILNSQDPKSIPNPEDFLDVLSSLALMHLGIEEKQPKSKGSLLFTTHNTKEQRCLSSILVSAAILKGLTSENSIFRRIAEIKTNIRKTRSTENQTAYQ